MKRHKRICDLTDNDIILLVNDYRDSDKSIRKLSEEHGIGKETIGYIFKKLGVVIRRRRTDEDWKRLADKIESNKL